MSWFVYPLYILSSIVVYPFYIPCISLVRCSFDEKEILGVYKLYQFLNSFVHFIEENISGFVICGK